MKIYAVVEIEVTRENFHAVAIHAIEKSGAKVLFTATSYSGVEVTGPQDDDGGIDVSYLVNELSGPAIVGAFEGVVTE